MSGIEGFPTDICQDEMITKVHDGHEYKFFLFNKYYYATTSTCFNYGGQLLGLPDAFSKHLRSTFKQNFPSAEVQYDCNAVTQKGKKQNDKKLIRKGMSLNCNLFLVSSHLKSLIISYVLPLSFSFLFFLLVIDSGFRVHDRAI
jgi:hypothetical protein